MEILKWYRGMSTTKIDPCAALELNFNVQRQLEKKVSDPNNFEFSVVHVKELITYLKGEKRF